jgi:hypothetical protein
MQPYFINEGHFLTPQGCEDETTNLLEWPPKDEKSGPFSLTINRDEPESGEDLRSYVARQLQSLRQELNRCEILHHKVRRIDGLPAEEVEFTWISDGEKLAQRQAFVIRQGKALAFTATMAQKFTSHGVWLWETVLSSFRFRENESRA